MPSPLAAPTDAGLDFQLAAVDGAHRPIRVEQMELIGGEVARPGWAHACPASAMVKALVFGQDSRKG